MSHNISTVNQMIDSTASAAENAALINRPLTAEYIAYYCGVSVKFARAMLNVWEDKQDQDKDRRNRIKYVTIWKMGSRRLAVVNRPNAPKTYVRPSDASINRLYIRALHVVKEGNKTHLIMR